jgi:hypothetical protein
MLRFVLVLTLAVGLLPAAQVMTGGCVVDQRSVVLPQARACGQTVESHELLRNPGFESGSLEHWETTNWVVTTIHPHSGTYCACDVGDYPITQWLDTTPCSDVQSVTFWARQPDQPAAQAYCFFYSDNSSQTFVHFPPDTWQQFDVSSNLDMGKNLVGLRIWGYSGGGPGPDSTYIDDVSILVLGGTHDVTVTEIICPRDTIAFDSTYIPVCRVANLGNVPELARTVMTIEHAGGSPYYTDTTEADVNPGDTATMSFRSYQPDSAVQHLVTVWTTLASDTNELNDTLRRSFWVIGQVSIAERQPTVAGVRPRATVMTGVSLRSLMSSRECSVRDASGRVALEPRPGVYFIRMAGLVRKVVVSR